MTEIHEGIGRVNRVNNGKNKITLLAMVFICIFVIFLFFLKIYVSFDSKEMAIDKGILNFQGRVLGDNEIVSLAGEWEFYWRQFLTEEEFETAEYNRIFAEIPKVWNKYTINEEHLPGFGYGTYRLHVKYDYSDTELAIRMPTVSTAYSLYVDDQFLGSNGKISKDGHGFIPEYQPQVMTFQPKNSEFDIIVQVANYSYARGGMWYQVYLGTVESVSHFHEIIKIKDLILIGAFLMFAGYHMLMYILRRNEKGTLILGYFSLCAAVRVLIYGDYSINYLFPRLGYYRMVRLDYITVALFSFLGILFVDDVFKEYDAIALKKYILSFSLILVAAALTLPIAQFTRFNYIYQYSSVIIGIYGVLYIFKNLKQREIEKDLFFIGLTTVILSALHDSLYQNNLIKSDLGELSPMGIMIFLIIQSLIMSIKNYQAYDELSLAKLKLEQLDMLKDEFLANTAHELRSPLNAIINICEGLHRDMDKYLSGLQKESLSTVVNNGKRLSLMINEILDYSKLKNSISSLDLKCVATVKMVKRIEDEFSLINLGRNENVHLIVDIPPNIPDILADESQLVQIFYNLIGNAISHIKEGYIKITVLHQEEFVKFILQYTGADITKNELTSIFEPYFQIESNWYKKATGMDLGFAITKKLVEEHGGQISIQFEEDKSAAVDFTIPVYHNQITGHVEKSSNLSARRFQDGYQPIFQFPYTYEGKGATVVIVDDNETNLISVISILKANNYSIMAFSNMDDFYAVFHENKSMDLVILDLMYSPWSGYEICETIRKKYSISEMPILMLTANTATKDIVHGLKSGANDYLSKPFDADEFLARVRTLIQMKLSVEGMRTSELSFLRAQIKPHFLFNAINTFITISRYDVEKAVSLMISFSQYLRKSFDFKDQSKTSFLKDEVELLKAYLEIEQTRFEERLEIEMDITKQQDIQVPILILQPIVENAIIHGVLPKIEGGKVTVTIKVKEEEMLFSVKDNGVGMDLNSDQINGSAQTKTSVGLKNIDARLKKLYGKGLVIESQPDVGTDVSWCIPVLKGVNYVKNSID